MPRTWNRTDTNGVKDRKTRDIFIKVDEYLIDVSKQLTLLTGSAAGAESSQVITPGASDLGTPIVNQSFLTVATDNSLLSDRTLAVSSSFTLTDGGAKGAYTLDVGSPFTASVIIADSINVNSLTVDNSLYAPTPAIVLGEAGSGTITVGTSITFDASTTYDIGTSLLPARNIYCGGLDGAVRLTPALVFGTTNVKGSNFGFIPANSTIALFDAVAPADDAATAVHGASLFASDSAHVHRFPTSLMEYTNSKKIVLTSSGTVSVLTSDVATVQLAGMTNLQPATTNALSLGGISNRWLKGWFGTNGIGNSGPYTQSGSSANTFTGNVTISGALAFSGAGGFSGSFLPTSDLTSYIGSTLVRWSILCGGLLLLADNTGSGSFNYQVGVTSTATADRALNFTPGDADRTITLSGNPTLADWFDQGVKVAGTPQFARMGIGTAADGTELIKLADPANVILGSTTGTKIGTASTQKLGFWGTTPVVRTSAYTPTNVVADRAYDANATSIDELADVLGTLIADLQSYGLLA